METRRAVAFETLRRNKSKEGALICKIKSGCKYAIDRVCHYFVPHNCISSEQLFCILYFCINGAKENYIRKKRRSLKIPFNYSMLFDVAPILL